MLVKRAEEKRGLLDHENGDFQKIKKESLLNEPQDPAKNSVGLIYAGLAITFIFTLIGFASYAVQQHAEISLSDKGRLNFEGVIEGDYIAKQTSCSWFGDNLVCQNEDSDYTVQNFGKSENSPDHNEQTPSQILLPYKTVKTIAQCWRCNVKFSNDLKYALVETKREQIFRHSYTATFFIIKVSSKENFPNKILKVHDSTRFRYAGFGHQGALLAFTGPVIHYFKNAFNESSFIISRQQTENENIWSGIPDWVYEEEVLESNEAFWSEKSGKYLAWAEFNDKDVHTIEIPRYGDLNDPYPEQLKVSYPKPGTTNPVAKLFVTDLTTTNFIELKPPLDIQNDMDTRSPILFKVQFATDSKNKIQVLVTWTNRIQNKAHTVSCSPISGECVDFYSRESYNGWLDRLTEDITFIEEDELSLVIDYCEDWVKIKSVAGGNTCLTEDRVHVAKVLATNSLGIFYSGMDTRLKNEKMVGDNIYLYKLKSQTTECLTCELRIDSIDSGVCDSWSAEFSDSGNHAILNCAGRIVPYSVLMKIGGEAENDKTGTFESKQTEINLVQALEENNRLRDSLKNVYQPTVIHFNVTLGGENFSARLLVPHHFLTDVEHVHPAGGYPMLMNVYAGPGQVKVKHNFNIDWHSWFVTEMNCVVLEVDGRGSYAGNISNMHSIYKNLGDLEIKDQISGAKQALKKYPQINADKVGIWGWSYGGYATLRALTEVDPEKFPFFECGTSVAPVADWRLYDTAYTERYMELPKNNKIAYADSSLLATSRLKNIKHYDGRYLLVHGTMDDNVHFQQSALLESKLVSYEARHRVQYYTDRTHSLSGLHTRLHLYRLLTEHFTSCFGIPNMDSDD